MRDNSYTECFFAFLDILGFKNMVNTKSCDQILHIYKDYTQLLLDIVYKDQMGNVQNVDGFNLVRHKVMSDSICFYIEANEYNALFCLLATCATLQRTLLELNEPVLIRGAITRGKIFANDNDILFGPALVKAYLAEEDAEFPRIVITKDVLEFGKNFVSPKEYLLPWFGKLTFCDFDNLYSVDFVKYTEWSIQKKQKVISFVESVLDTTMDKRIRTKYLYLYKRLAQKNDKEKTDA